MKNHLRPISQPEIFGWTTFAGVLFALVAAFIPDAYAQGPRPTHADVSYGSHERQILDLYVAKSDTPTPLALYIHGGGFVNGDKRSLNSGVRDRLLAAGISVAAINYRYATQVALPAAHHDGARALQVLRSRAAEWNLDKSRVGVFGGSAGAQIALYLGFHDDLANPAAADPIARESTRVTCVGSASGQVTIDPEWMIRWIPGYTKADRDVGALFGVKGRGPLVRALAEVAALNLLTADDPPVMMTYGMAPDDPIPTDPKKVTGWQVHHVVFGVKLKERMDALGIEAHLVHPRARSKYHDFVAFMQDKLGRSN